MDGESIDRFPCIRKKRWSWVEDTFVFVPKAWNGPRQETARHADVTWSRSSVVKTHCFHRWYPGICPGRRVQELDYRQRGVGAGFSGRLPRVSGIVLGFSSIPLPSPSLEIKPIARKSLLPCAFRFPRLVLDYDRNWAAGLSLDFNQTSFTLGLIRIWSRLAPFLH